MRIYPGAWSNGQLAARICWSGTWSGGAVGMVIGAVVLLWIDRAELVPSAAIVVWIAMMSSAVVGATHGLLWGVIAALLTLGLARVDDHQTLRPTRIALQVLAIIAGLNVLWEMHSHPSLIGLLTALQTIVLGAGPLVVLVRRQVLREQLQERAAWTVAS